MLLIDTNALIDWDHLDLPGGETFCASILSRGELEFGIHAAATSHIGEERRARLNAWDDQIEWQPVTEASTRSYGLLAARCLRAGAPAKARKVDMHIAAQAHALGAGLLTANIADFEIIRGLVRIVATQIRAP